jgi:capsular exopolysaccharide synthesis family protein
MEPLDYLKILRKHWRAVAALVVFAVGLVYLLSPAEASGSYRAEHLLRVTSSTGEEVSMDLDNVSVAKLYVTTGEVPAAAAAVLGVQGVEAVEELVDNVNATADPEVGSLTITANDSDPDRAVLIADAFGAAFIDFVAREQGVGSAGEDAAGGEDAPLDEDDIILRIAQIDDQLERANPPSNSVELRAERTSLERMLDGESAIGPISYETVTPALTASSDAVMFQTRGQRMLLAAGVALLLGFGVAVVLDRSDTRLRTKEQAEKRFSLPVLAEVPLLPLRERGRAAVVAYEREPGVAEAYRSLRTALMLFRGYDRRSSGDRTTETGDGNGHLSAGRPGRDLSPTSRQLVVVTSAEPGDGKSTTVANLAMAYAEAGDSVLILGWDLWRPLTPAVFGAVDGPGIIDCLDEAPSSLLRCVQHTSIRGVRIVTSGSQGGRPSPRSEDVRNLLEEARSLASVVLVDTAPLLSASVTRELATAADAVLVVARAGRTTTDAADRCTEMLDRIGANALGVVLVGVATGAFADYYGPARKPGHDRVAGPRRRPTTSGGRGLAEPVGQTRGGL